MRGSLKDKLNWLFNFYDIYKKGKVGRLEIINVIKSFYALIKQKNNQTISPEIVFDHVFEVFKVLFFYIIIKLIFIYKITKKINRIFKIFFLNNKLFL